MPRSPENFFLFFKHNRRRKHTVASTSRDTVASTSKSSSTTDHGTNALPGDSCRDLG